ncbi:hypothetical protein LZ30DRAFT_311049 [Colletotrichum cereale]|nr:hypothetical protein LZ30DRAFT_311049 [Colletotrichum cereale]
MEHGAEREGTCRKRRVRHQSRRRTAMQRESAPRTSLGNHRGPYGFSLGLFSLLRLLVRYFPGGRCTMRTLYAPPEMGGMVRGGGGGGCGGEKLHERNWLLANHDRPPPPPGTLPFVGGPGVGRWPRTVLISLASFLPGPGVLAPPLTSTRMSAFDWGRGERDVVYSVYFLLICRFPTPRLFHFISVFFDFLAGPFRGCASASVCVCVCVCV